MRVLQITNDYFNSGVYENLQNAFIKSGLDSFVFVPASFEDPDRNCGQNIIYERCFSKWDRFFYHNKQKKIYGKLREHVRKLSPDILHSHFLFSGGYACYLANKEFGVPYITAVQNTDINVFFRYMLHLRKLGLKVLLNASCIIFISEAYLEFFLDRYVPICLHKNIRDKSVVIPFPINDFWIQNRIGEKPSPAPGEIKLITVGVIAPNKNQLTVAKAAEILKKEKGFNVEYKVIGTIIDKSYYKKLVKYPFVKYVPQCGKEELIKYYRKADIFVMTSIYESFGMVYPEAMSQGLPVVYSLGQGFDKQFSEGAVGFHANKTDAADIANAITKTILDYNSISKRCIINCSNFSGNIVCGHYVNVYNNILYKDKGVNEI